MHELEWLRDVCQRLAETNTLDEVLDVVYDAIHDGLGYDRVGINLFDYDAGVFADLIGTDAAGNKYYPSDRQMPLSPDSPVWRIPGNAAMLRGEAYYTEDVVAECPPDLLYLFDGTPRHNIMVPLRVGNRITGMISVDNLLSGRPIACEDVGALLSLATQVSRAMENARLQKALQESEARYRSIYESASVGIATSDEDGRILSANPTYERFIGYSEEELCRMSWADLTHPDDREQQERFWEEVQRTGARDGRLEKRYVRKDGRVVWGSLNLAPGTTPEGEHGFSIASVEDITDRKQAETALVASEKQYRTLVETTADAIIFRDGEGTIMMANQQAAVMHGYDDPAELIGLNLADLVAPQERHTFRQRVKSLPAVRMRRNMDHVGLRKDGTTFPAETSASFLPASDSQPASAVIVIRDVTARKRAETSLRESEERYRSVVETTVDGIVIINLSGGITFANSQAATLLGFTSPQDMLGRQNLSVIAPEDRELAIAEMTNLIMHGEPVSIQCALLRTDGTSFPAEINGSLIRNVEGEPIAVTAVIRDVTERKAYIEELRRQALHDALTGLPNRTLYQDRVSHALSNSRRDGEPFSLLLLDLDRFKEINDTLGHGAGDLLLQEVANRFRRVTRESDTVARLGGDEFALLLTNADARRAMKTVIRILSELEPRIMLDGQPVYVTASIGIASYPEHGDDAATLLRRADVAMYTAKRTGSSYAVYEETADPHSRERLKRMADLRHAIEHHQLVLHYQPQVSLKTGCAEHVEALVRWIHPDEGFIPPDQFIPLAEQTGLITPLTHWVLNEAVRQAAAWHAAGLDIEVAVNLSALNLEERDLVHTVAAVLDRWEVPASVLCLEITESALMRDPTRAMTTLTLLHDLGVHISIDDFGTGYSSLAYLKRLPVDQVKIDRSFVLEMIPSEESCAIVRSVIDLGHNLKLQVVAEGVETQRELDALTLMGCDLAQGFYLGHPMPAAEYPLWLGEWRQSVITECA